MRNRFRHAISLFRKHAMQTGDVCIDVMLVYGDYKRFLPETSTSSESWRTTSSGSGCPGRRRGRRRSPQKQHPAGQEFFLALNATFVFLKEHL